VINIVELFVRALRGGMSAVLTSQWVSFKTSTRSSRHGNVVADLSTKNPISRDKGNALRAKLALESKKRVLAAEAAKQAKRDAKKKPKAVKPTKFAPDIVGKVYSSNNNAQRKIKDYILKNYLTIPSDYQFGVNKIDWGKYEITGSRALTPNKKSRKVAAT
jgi:hypothetical protein